MAYCPSDEVKKVVDGFRLWGGQRFQHTPFNPKYPNAVPILAARTLLGETPEQVAKGLTPEEAHEWLQSGNPSEEDWMRERIQLSPFGVDVRAARGAYYLPTARWLSQIWMSGRQQDMYREVTLLGRGVDESKRYPYKVRLVEHVYWIEEQDLPEGPSTPVETAFRLSASRRGYDWPE